MSGPHPPWEWSTRAYLLFLGAVVAALLALAGAAVAVASLRGDDSLPAALAALAAVGSASAVSGVLIAFTGGAPAATLTRNLLATLIRLLLVAGLAAVCVFVLEVPRGPFLAWLLVSYLALLAIDTGFSVRRARGRSESL